MTDRQFMKRMFIVNSSEQAPWALRNDKRFPKCRFKRTANAQPCIGGKQKHRTHSQASRQFENSFSGPFGLEYRIGTLLPSRKAAERAKPVRISRRNAISPYTPGSKGPYLAKTVDAGTQNDHRGIGR